MTVKVSVLREVLSGEVVVRSVVLVMGAVHVCPVSVARAVGNDLVVEVSVEDRVAEAAEVVVEAAEAVAEEVEAAGRDEIVSTLSQIQTTQS